MSQKPNKQNTLLWLNTFTIVSLKAPIGTMLPRQMPPSGP